MNVSVHGTPKNAWLTHAPRTQKTGMPIAEIQSGNSMCFSTSGPASFARRFSSPLKISGRPKSPTSDPTTIIVTPHHNDHWLTISTRDNGTSAPSGPTRAAMSPARIVIGARITKLTNAPSSTLVATAMPMSPPTPSIAASSVRRRPRTRRSVPRIVGTYCVALPMAA